MPSTDTPNTESYKMTGKCPFGGDRIGGAHATGHTLEDWYPDRLRVEALHNNGAQADALGLDFDYEAAFNALDFEALKQDIKDMLVNPVSWWPADYGNYGPQMVRMAWHSAGTYRIADGRGGAGEAMQRFAPINSWWDNGNTDKSRRLLWPIKQKYGAGLSWADLIVLTGNCALEIMGFPTTGFGGGRRDANEADTATYWGPEIWDPKKTQDFSSMVMREKRWKGAPDEETYDLENPLAASHQALIYVNPEGPNGNGNPAESARDIRITFTRMAMNDEETVALIAGGHAFGKSHGMVSPDEVGPPPEIAPIEAQGLGWHNPEGTGFAQYTMTNGIEGSWTPNPTQWDNSYLENLFKYEWEQTTSPAGALQWKPKDPNAPRTPDAHIEGQMNELMMMTSDLALKVDPEYRKICEKFLADFDYFTEAFSQAWFKLTHRDMGPKSRYLGPEVPSEDFAWQDPLPQDDVSELSEQDIDQLKTAILESGLSVSDLVSVAWSSASSYRHSDKRGGANGARIRLAPQKDWEINNPERVQRVMNALEKVKADFENQTSKTVSLADLIVLGGSAAVEKAARDAGVEANVAFTSGRKDATQEQTDVEMFNWLRPVSDGFRNYHESDFEKVSPEQFFLDRARLLALTAPEWVVLTGGLRVLDTNYDGSKTGVFTDTPGVLSNDFFKTVTSMDYHWRKLDDQGLSFSIDERDSGEQKYTATRCDLIMGSNQQLRNISEIYASDDGHARMVKDFVKAWQKVMMLDRYDVAEARKAATSLS